MKKQLLLSALIVLALTTYSCSADDIDSANKTNEVEKKINTEIKKYADGLGDLPIPVPPPPPPKQ
ncbi:hypothetical protein [Flavobacterium bizetiae]|uniref:hypothetical protein n=1 Tax=Flavobacterium bizetiae TaxID=2704140 RepID=UPI0037571795